MNDMFLVKGTYHTVDRWPLKVTKIEASQSQAFDATAGTYYIMLQNASYYSDSTKFESVNGHSQSTIILPLNVNRARQW